MSDGTQETATTTTTVDETTTTTTSLSVEDAVAEKTAQGNGSTEVAEPANDPVLGDAEPVDPLEAGKADSVSNSQKDLEAQKPAHDEQ